MNVHLVVREAVASVRARLGDDAFRRACEAAFISARARKADARKPQAKTMTEEQLRRVMKEAFGVE